MQLLPTRLDRLFLVWTTLSILIAILIGGFVHRWAMMTMGWEYPLDYLITVPIFIPLIVSFFIFIRRIVIRPIRTIIKHNIEFSEGLQESAIIPPEEIPLHEIGDVMETRNRMLQTLFNYQKELAG